MIIMVSSLLMAAAGGAQNTPSVSQPPHPSLTRLIILTVMMAGINEWERPMFPGDKLNIDREEEGKVVLHYLVTARRGVEISFFWPFLLHKVLWCFTCFVSPHGDQSPPTHLTYGKVEGCVVPYLDKVQQQENRPCRFWIYHLIL